MICRSCGMDEMKESTNTYLARLTECYVIIENVPCFRCDQCGEGYYEASVLEKIDDLLDRLVQLANKILVVDYDTECMTAVYEDADKRKKPARTDQKKSEIPDYRRMFRVAETFSDIVTQAAGDGCAGDIGWTQPYLIPEIVNRAFSCEVYLKSLLVFSEKILGRNHKLINLWESVPEVLKMEIRHEMDVRFVFSEEHEFEDMLEKTSDAFVKWRYAYEVSALNGYPGFLCAFSDSLREVCCRKYFGCSWDKYKE